MKYIVGLDVYTGDLDTNEAKKLLSGLGVKIANIAKIGSNFHSVDLIGGEKDLIAALKTIAQDIDPEVDVQEVMKNKVTEEDLQKIAKEVGASVVEVIAAFHSVVAAPGKLVKNYEYKSKKVKIYDVGHDTETGAIQFAAYVNDKDTFLTDVSDELLCESVEQMIDKGKA